MAAIKKYNGSTFVDAAIRKYSTASEIIVPPTTIYCDGSNITTYTIKGNTVQNGTPTPSDPVPVVGVGELETTGEHSGEYKIPISSGGVTTNLYLGSTQTVRQVKKLVLDGNEESWSRSTSYLGGFFSSWSNYGGMNYGAIYCSHAQYVPNITDYVNGTCYSDGSLNIRIMPEGSTVTQWREYLAQQYANGTPVTVWYVLQTATTGTVNEPLMAIGDYADTLSNATAIPTTEGANSITVDTTVQPSEFSATWTGWHNAYVKEKSENLLDMSQSVYGEGLTAGIGATTPTFAPSAATSHSGMIKVKSDTEYTIKLSEAPTTSRSIYMYDSSQVFTRVYPTQQSTISLTITTGATEEYIIFGYNIDDTQAMLVEGSTAPSEFVPYWE